MTHDDASLVKQKLDITKTEWKDEIKPDRLLDDVDRKTMLSE